MRKIYITILLSVLSSIAVMAQKALIIQRTNGVTDMALTSAIDSIEFNEDGTKMIIASNNTKTIVNIAEVKSIRYGENAESASITYNDNYVSIINPYFLQGVTTKSDGANVTIDNSNTSTELKFELSGTTTNGSFVYNGNYKTTFVLNGVNITSTKGAAIDIECGKRILMELKKGTTNTLVDAANGKQKAALYCKGHLEIDKTGTLNVTGNTKHAISAKEYIQLKKSEGKINILGSKSDGIHCGQYFLANGYTVKIDNVVGDGIQAEKTEALDYAEDYPDGSLWIQGGTFNINCASDNVAGLKADADININATKSAPKITIKMTGTGSKGLDAVGEVKIAEGITLDITEQN